MIKIASCQYKIEELPDWESYVAKIENLVMDAKKQDATILLLPEYAGTEAACQTFDTDEQLYTALQPLIPKYIALYKGLAQTQQIYIQAGTITEKTASGQFANRAYLFSPSGSYDYQDKLQLIEYEKDTQLFQKGNQQKIFTTPFGKIGIAVCYDSEFPDIIQRLVQHGATLILVPSYTTTLAGYYRVFLTCRARAIENQCYIAISHVVDKVTLSGEVEEAQGQAAILGPADVGFPDDGIIAQGVMNQPMLIVEALSLEALDRVREAGHVHNFKDAMCYMQIDKNEIEIIEL